MTNHKKRLTWIIRALLTIALISGGILFSYAYSLRHSKNEFDDLAKIFHGSQVSEQKLVKNKETKLVEDSLPEGELAPRVSIPLQDLYERNNDIAGWLTIEGTRINYPVMHTPDQPDYYLHRNFAKAYSFSGVPFIDGKYSFERPSDNMLIHGHNMNDGSMFADLLLYKDEAFLKDHPAISLFTFSGEIAYTIIGVVASEVYNDKNTDFDYHNFIDAKDQVAFDSYIAKVKKHSLFDTGVTAEYGEQLITLSTCAYHTTHGRLVVIAKAEGKTLNK